MQPVPRGRKHYSLQSPERTFAQFSLKGPCVRYSTISPDSIGHLYKRCSPNMGKWDNVKVQFGEKSFSGSSPDKLLLTWVEVTQDLVSGDPESRWPVGPYVFQAVLQKDIFLSQAFDRHWVWMNSQLFHDFTISSSLSGNQTLCWWLNKQSHVNTQFARAVGKDRHVSSDIWETWWGHKG